MSGLRASIGLIVVVQTLAAHPTVADSRSAAAGINCTDGVLPTNASSTLDRALQLRTHGRVSEAESQVYAVLDKAPLNPRALYSLGMVQINRGQTADALKNLQLARDVKAACGNLVGPLRSNVYNNIGYSQILLGQYVDAADSFQAALASTDLPESSRVKAQANLGYVYFVTGDFDKAKPILEAAARKSRSASYTLDLIRKAEVLPAASGAVVVNQAGEDTNK